MEVGCKEGQDEGCTVGSAIGTADGCDEGTTVGTSVGQQEGMLVGRPNKIKIKLNGFNVLKEATLALPDGREEG
jgi:hypothetical protein